MTSKFNLPMRKLLGPGPANVDPRVMEAMQVPAIGHMDPAFMEVLAETADLLRYAFGTENDVTMAVSGTGFSGLDMALSNALEPGDIVRVVESDGRCCWPPGVASTVGVSYDRLQSRHDPRR